MAELNEIQRKKLATVAIVMLLFLFIQLYADSMLIYFYRDDCPYCQDFTLLWYGIIGWGFIDPSFNTISYDINTEEGHEKFMAFGGKTVPGLFLTRPDGPALKFEGERNFNSIVGFAQQ